MSQQLLIVFQQMNFPWLFGHAMIVLASILQKERCMWKIRLIINFLNDGQHFFFFYNYPGTY